MATQEVQNRDRSLSPLDCRAEAELEMTAVDPARQSDGRLRPCLSCLTRYWAVGP